MPVEPAGSRPAPGSARAVSSGALSFWPYRQFGVRALLAEGRIEEALAYAEAARGLNQQGVAIDAACERILLDAGRDTEACEKYALAAAQSSAGLATYRMSVRKYPGRDPKRILLDLAESSSK